MFFCLVVALFPLIFYNQISEAFSYVVIKKVEVEAEIG